MAKIQDIDIPHLEFAEAAAPATPAAAIVRIYAKADGLLYSKDDAGVETLVSGGAGGALGAWTNYTPTWTGSGTAPAIGNGTLIGRYKALDSTTYLVRILVLFGSTTTAGSTQWRFTLPSGVTSAATQVIPGYITDSGTGFYAVTANVSNAATTIGAIIAADAAGTREVGLGVPMTWTTNDLLVMQGVLEVTVA